MVRTLHCAVIPIGESYIISAKAIFQPHFHVKLAVSTSRSGKTYQRNASTKAAKMAPRRAINECDFKATAFMLLTLALFSRPSILKPWGLNPGAQLFSGFARLSGAVFVATGPHNKQHYPNDYRERRRPHNHVKHGATNRHLRARVAGTSDNRTGGGASVSSHVTGSAGRRIYQQQRKAAVGCPTRPLLALTLLS